MASIAEPITVVKRNFAMFTDNQAGTGPAVIQNFNSATDQPLNTLLAPAHPGQTVTLWGTGAGAVSGDETSGPLPGALAGVNLTVYVGNVPASVRYIGRSGCCAGVDQLVFDVLAQVSGCYLPVVITGAGLYSDPQNIQIPAEHAVSNFGTISVAAPGSACIDATGLNASELSTLQRGFGLKMGWLAFERIPQPQAPQSSDFVSGQFGTFNALTFLRTQGVFGLPALGTCLNYLVPAVASVQSDPVQAVGLDIGPTLNISGPVARANCSAGAMVFFPLRWRTLRAFESRPIHSRQWQRRRRYRRVSRAVHHAESVGLAQSRRDQFADTVLAIVYMDRRRCEYDRARHVFGA